jgi:D-cysteine desulfhydrase
MAAQELADDLATLPARPTTIVYACGSGGTGAGLVLGSKLLGQARSGIRYLGVNVCDDRDYFVRTIGAICRDFDDRFQAGAAVEASDIDILDGYVGLGYARSRDEELSEIIALARREAILVDPVYTGKAYFAMSRELARDPSCFGQRVVFLHTGGVFGLFPVAAQLGPLL